MANTSINTRVNTNIEAPPGYGWYCADWGGLGLRCRLLSDFQIAYYHDVLPGLNIDGPHPDFNTCSIKCANDPYNPSSWYCLEKPDYYGTGIPLLDCWFVDSDGYNQLTGSLGWVYSAGPWSVLSDCQSGCQPVIDTTPGEKRKWFHATLKLLDPNQAIRATMTSLDTGDVSINANDRVRARESSLCSSVTIPVPAWNPMTSPGLFYFRASQSDLASGPGWVVPTDYDSVVSLQNRFTFEYVITAALDSTDTTCSSIGPPNTLDPVSPYSDVKDVACNPISNSCQNISFLFSPIEYIQELGCCGISVTNPGPILPPGPVNTDANRGWFISSPISSPNSSSTLFSYDTSSSQLVNRGDIALSGIGTLDFLGLTWDNRSYLWGLERQGLRQILPGLAPDNNAIALGYAQVIDNTGGDLLSKMFPINDSVTTGTIKFNPNNNMLYIFVDGVFYELSKDREGGWAIGRYLQYPSNVIISDIAFDPFGKCYGLYNGDLVTIGIDNDFGSIRNITNDRSLDKFIGLDFILNTTGSSLYGITDENEPDIKFVRIDKTNGAVLSEELASNIHTKGTTHGLAGTISGETTTVSSLPFQSGKSPWLFLIEGSSAMKGYDRWETVMAGMEAFLTTEVFAGDKMFIAVYGGDEQVVASDAFDFRTTDDIARAKEWLGSKSPSGRTIENFCNNVLNKEFFYPYKGVKNIVVIGSSGFSEYCNQAVTSNFSSYVRYILDILISNGADQSLVFRGVGIYPEANGRNDLKILGNSGGGGYTEWVKHA